MAETAAIYKVIPALQGFFFARQFSFHNILDYATLFNSIQSVLSLPVLCLLLKNHYLS